MTVKRRRTPKKPHDHGTPEQQAKRARLVGAGNDETLAHSPLGVLKARGLINEDQYLAGEKYAQVMRVFVGKVGPRISGAEITGDEPPDHKLVQAQKDLKALSRRLSTRVKTILDNVCVYEFYPSYLISVVGSEKIRDGDKEDFRDLLTGLDTVVAYYG